MGLYVFRLPDIGEGIAEAEVVAWHVAVGHEVEEDQALVDLMTDKATVEMSSPVAGRVLVVHSEVGGRVAVGAPLVELEIPGLDGPGDKPAAPVRLPVPTPIPAVVSTKADAVGKAETPAIAKSAVPAFALRDPAERPLASPAIRRRAHERGIPLQFVPGTGPAGRITAEDLDAFIAHGGATPARPLRAARTGVVETKIVGLRRAIAERMQEAKRRIPHFSYVEEFDLTELEALRRDLNAERAGEQPKLTLLPFFMRALALLAPAFPQINARYDDEAGVLTSYAAVHVGIATQTGGGLMVPVVRHAEALDIWESARELARVTKAARDGKATRGELTGSTITLTSLGALGGIAATPVINHPEVAIIGPNKLVERPVVIDRQVVVRTMMNLSASFDHRIVDGYDAAQFVQRLKRLIERPALLFVEHA